MSMKTRAIAVMIAASLAVLGACSGDDVTTEPAGSTTTTDVAEVLPTAPPAPTTTTPAPVTTIARPVATAPPQTAAPEPYYANCDAVRAAGKAPLHRGEPGYRSGLDRDGDGVACE